MQSLELRERLIKATLFAATMVSVVAALSIFALLLYFSLPLFSIEGLRTVISWEWRPFSGHFGIMPMMVGSLLLSTGALLIACPAGIGICAFISVLAPGRFARPVSAIVHYMTSIPTVIYGFVSIFLLVPLIRDWLDKGTGLSLLTATITLSLLILPTIVLVYSAYIREKDKELKLTGAALGFSKSQYFLFILFPLTKKGLIIASILGFGRAVGDTLISLMLAGNTPLVPQSIFDSIRTLTSHIALVIATDSQSTFYHSVFAAGLLLFILMTAINIIIRKIGNSSQ
ncbi:PstC family ABC transporter permease [Desulfonatronovibrio hydrogenovorans]|uniref:PstC family ABC transporter permease n=1 Tax=Desulfonatronovibrio hydrogenovorans TaxID=53245 RepID=UPI000B2D6EC4|nr:ABC transporter permease subunit [Desulfonatronovibrio hydrogenovorans]